MLKSINNEMGNEYAGWTGGEVLLFFNNFCASLLDA